MDLRSDQPYSLLTNGIIHTYPSLKAHLKADVAIIGAGISGALVANYLTKAGFNTVVVDRRHAGMGSTAASSSLLQYEIDVSLTDLIKRIGEKNAVASYKLCRRAIYELEKISKPFNDPGLFMTRPSLQFASFKNSVGDLQKEYNTRKKAGFEVQWLDQSSLEKKFGFRKPAALFSEDGGETDAYKLTHYLLQASIRAGARIYDQTEIVKVRYPGKHIELLSVEKFKISAKFLVIACGYESQRYIPKKVGEVNSTFVIISEPLKKGKPWARNSLIWETATPYLYMRTTADNRIMVGGKDIPSSDPFKRDALLPRKAKALEKSFHKLFPEIPFKTDFRWAGNFASTKHGLPYIGSIPQRPNTYFALGFGGNGITFSVIAAEIIRDLLTGKPNRNSDLFRFNR